MKIIDTIRRDLAVRRQRDVPLPTGYLVHPDDWQGVEGDEGVPMSRAARRRMGIYGLVQKPRQSHVQRYVVRHYIDGMFDKYGPGVYTRRQRRHRARIMRAMKARGL